MKYIKIYIRIITIIFITTFITSSLSYLNIINEKTQILSNNIIILVTLLIEGFILGKKKEEKGFLEGIKIGSIISITFLLLRLLIKKNIIIEKILFYFLIIISSTIGSIIGINKK